MHKPLFYSVEEILVATAEMVRPPERLTVPQSAEKYRMLNNVGSYVGPWRNSKTPYLVEPMEMLTSLDHTGLVFAGPARTGKTDMVFNWLNHTAVCDPMDMMVIQMTQAVARDWSQGDLKRAFKHTKSLGDKVAPGRQNQNVHDINFRNGMRLLVKWPSSTELSGKTIPRLWLSDYDRMPDDVDHEGSPYDLAKKRSQTYGRFGMTVAESSPGRDVTDPNWMPSSPHEAPPTTGILALYNRGDRRRWYWRCPQCRESFEPHPRLFSYPTCDDPNEAAEQVVMICPHDGFPIGPDMKEELNSQGKWIKEGQVWLPDGSVKGRGRVADIASFWMFGPAAAFQSWKEIVRKYLVAAAEFDRNQDETALKTWTNLDIGDAYVPKSMEAARLPEELKNRSIDWGGSAEEPIVPEGVRFLVATIDVQAGAKSAFVVQVHGFGEGGDVSIIDMFKIRKSKRLDADGDPLMIDPAAYPEDWDLIKEQVIEKTYPVGDGSGRRMQVKATGCDSGGKEGVTTNAYDFWRRLRGEPEGHHKRFTLIKGEPSKSAPRVRRGFPDSGNKTNRSAARGDVPVLFLNSNSLKDTIYGMLGRTDSAVDSAARVSLGMVQFPAWAEDWLYKQLTAEVRTAKGWENPTKRRNEAWDLLYYAVGVAIYDPIRLEKINWNDPPSWAAEWDRNDLVFDPVGRKEPLVAKRPANNIAALASLLA